MKKIVQVAFSVYAMLLFVMMLLLIFPLVLLCAPAGKIKGGNFIYRICTVWSDAWFAAIGIKSEIIRLSRHPLPDRQYIFVGNHISYLDIPMIVNSIRQPARVLGKAEMANVPLFGLLYRYGAILVDRESAADRKKSVRQLASVLRKGISVFIFPEGTFNTTAYPLKSFYDGAFRMAIETQTAILPVIFPDTVNRLHYDSLFTFTPGRCRAIFLDMVQVAGLSADDIPQLKSKVYAAMQTALEKHSPFTKLTAITLLNS